MDCKLENMHKKIDKKARHESRKLAVRVFFTYLERNEKVEMRTCFEHVLHDLDGQFTGDDFAWKLLNLAKDNIKQAKVLVRSFASEFTFEKIASINKSILILGIVEMQFFDTPPIVVINEYIELSKEYGEIKSSSFINAVLDEARKSLGKERVERAILL